MNASFFRITTTVIFLLLTSALFSQQLEDSLHIKSGNFLKNKFDGLKLGSVDYQQGSSSDYKMKMKNEKYENGDLSSTKRVNAKVSIPLYFKKNYIISTSWAYKYAATEFKDITRIPISQPTLSHHDTEDAHFITGAASFTYFDKLFGREIFYSISLVGDGSQRKFENINGMIAATITLRKTSHTHMAAGLYGSTSRSSIFPFFPIFTYMHRFTDSNWLIDATLPSHAYLRRTIGKNGRLSLGMEMESNTSYIYPGETGFKQRYTFNIVNINGVISYEHFVAKNILANVRIGISKCYEGVLREKNTTKDIVKVSQDANFMCNVGVSYIIGK